MNILNSVSCPSSRMCAAVGYETPNPGYSVTVGVTEVWNGRAWKAARAPEPARATGVELNSVFCLSRDNCVAVGEYDTHFGNSSDGQSRAGIEAWNGSSWRMVPVRAPAGSVLSDVSCASAHMCLAAGSYGAPYPKDFYETWNGAAWKLSMPPARPAGSTTATLSALSCLSAEICVGIGWSSRPGHRHTALAEAWNGSKW